jgi:hypothetical protein
LFWPADLALYLLFLAVYLQLPGVGRSAKSGRQPRKQQRQALHHQLTQQQMMTQQLQQQQQQQQAMAQAQQTPARRVRVSAQA